jgi:hypothetical protein
MPLRSVALPARLDQSLRAVRFAMQDGSRRVFVLVSQPALEDIDSPPPDDGCYFDRFKQYRKSFERIASDKYAKGHIETDGTVCIRAMDLRLGSTT